MIKTVNIVVIEYLFIGVLDPVGLYVHYDWVYIDSWMSDAHNMAILYRP